jgi:hypothetical protein
MTILRLVHEGADAELPGKMADFSSASLMRRWQAGESDVGTSLTHPLWLAPPPRRLGVVVHELRGGVAAPAALSSPRDFRENAHAVAQQGHHHLRGDRLDPHPDDEPLSAANSGRSGA